ncbi:MAG: macro domain-containing protein [Deltaproteobacteria bacterium]|nr:macro domain-containing protein [Deltaproteobacteria bacterium]
MGAGVALAAKKRYPKMFEAYKRACDTGELRPGVLNIWKTSTEWVINFPTKRHWKEKSKYEDIEAGLVALESYLRPLGPVRVALPALGCGHGGLDWGRVLPMIQRHLADLEAKIFVFEPKASVEAGQRYSKRRPGRPSEGKPNPSQVVLDSNTFLVSKGLDRIFLLGKGELLLRRTLSVLVTGRPSESERSAAEACVAAVAREGLVVATAYEKPEWRRISERALEMGASAVVWTGGGIERVKVPSALLEPMAEGKIAMASLTSGSGPPTKETARKTNLAVAGLARAVLVAGLSLDRDMHEVLEAAKGTPTFFVRFRDAFPEDVAWLQSAGARPIGRRSSDLSPNVDALRSELESQTAPSDT